MRILLIKTSSLGDVIHNLPVVTDLRKQLPAAQIDWAVEEAFAEIPRLHPAVTEVIPVAVRRWRRQLASPATWREVSALRRRLREARYDLAIDTQGLLKSAWIARWSGAPTCGHGRGSAREPLASRCYDRTHDIPNDLHAIARNRRLAALCASHAISGAPDYGIATSITHISHGAAVLLTATSRDDKLWPEDRWIALGQALHGRGIPCRLPAGAPAERERAARIAGAIADAIVLPPSGLRDLSAELAGARLTVGVDTGLVHLAAAVGCPTLALFSASDPELTGVLAATPAINLGRRGAAPSVDEVLAAALPLL